MRALGLWRAQEAGRQVVEALGIQRPDEIDIYEIVAKFRAAVFEAALDGAEAQLARRRDLPTITLSTSARDAKKRMFDLGHELGHLVLGHRSAPAHELAEPGEQKRRSENERDMEAEASTFASELLTPFAMLVRYEGATFNADLVRTIATTFPSPCSPRRSG